MVKVFSATLGAIYLLAIYCSQVQAAALDVVISEVAWSGTGAEAGSSDEWIELYNNTSSTIDLTGWILASTDNSPNISLSGKTISANSYFLLERTADTTISNISADMMYSGALNDSGEILQLKDASSNLIDSANGDGSAWPGGTGSSGTPARASMERKNLTQADTDSNWVSNDGVTTNGTDSSGNSINGTPKLANSGGYVPTPSPTVAPTTAPTATPTATPTSAPAATSTPTPTKKPSPKPTSTPSATPTDEPEVVLAANTEATPEPSPMPEIKESGLLGGKNLIGIVFTVLGTGFIALAGYSFFKGKSSDTIKTW